MLHFNEGIYASFTCKYWNTSLSYFEKLFINLYVVVVKVVDNETFGFFRFAIL